MNALPNTLIRLPFLWVIAALFAAGACSGLSSDSGKHNLDGESDGDSDSDTDTDIDTDTDADVDTDTDTDAEADTETVSDSAEDTQSDSADEPESDTATEGETDSEGDSEDSESDSAPDSEWDADSETTLPDDDPFAPPSEYAPSGPYAEAFQKSLYFYDVNMSGKGITGGRIEWRGDSDLSDYAVSLFCNSEDKKTADCVDMSEAYVKKYLHVLDPDGDGTINVGGGFHDCGDHVKFGITEAYSASMLGWALYEFPDAFKKSGQAAHAVDILKRFADYFLRSTFRETDGRVIAFCHQVGNGDVDHQYWGPPELQQSENFGRPAFFATEEVPGADVTAGAAAALALTGLVIRPRDPDYADKCLDNAVALYEFAVAHPGVAVANGGYYQSQYEWDDLSWAAVWLHIATGEKSYLDDVISESGTQYTGYLSHIMSSTADGWYNAWTHCWNMVWTGTFIKLAQLTDDPRWMRIAEDNADLWSGLDGKMTVTPGGLTWLNGWGSLRYTTAAMASAMVWAEYTGNLAYVDWAESQFDYMTGNNPYGWSYIVGFGDAWPTHIHNRAAHGSTQDNSLDVPATPSHTAWGALLGGPDADDSYVDDIWNYVQTESCIDYASSLVGALAGLYHFKAVDKEGLGQAPIEDFPPPEPAEREFWIEAKSGEDNGLISETKLVVHNETTHPPRLDPLLSFRYFFDVSELEPWGQGVEAFRIQPTYDGRLIDNGMLNSGDGKPTLVTGPFPYDEAAGIYYFEFAYDGLKFYGPMPFEFQLVAKIASDNQSHQTSSNDYSHQGLSANEFVITPYIPLYSDGKLIAGQEP